MSVDESAGTYKPLPKIGSYRLLQPLGTGGMSSVFRAIHEETGHEVALKILPRNLAKNSTLLQRFLREAKSAESLEHPNIVAIYDRGIDQGKHYLALEFVPGGDLHDYVRDNGPLGITETISVIRGVAEGLRYAASRGLIHRDIKPANLLRAPAGHAKIIDLGLALQWENEDERVTREGTTVGTVDYMSPEQARDSRATTVRSDIYSLGCTMYYLVTGSPPFQGGNIADKLTKHCTLPPPDPRELRPSIPIPLARLIQRMMAKKPDNRFADYDELIAALDSVASLVASSESSEPLDAIVVEDDDDDSDDAIVLELANPEATPPPSKPREQSPDPLGFTLAELAALDSDSPSRPAVRRPSSSSIITPGGARPAESEARSSGSPLPRTVPVDDDEEEVEGKLIGPPPMPYGGMDPATKKWITRLIVSSVAIVLLVIGIDQLVRSSMEHESSSTVMPEEGELSSSTTEPAAPVEPPPMLRPRSAPSGPGQVAVNSSSAAPYHPTPNVPKVASKPAAVVQPPWVEPVDPNAENVAEPDYPAAVEDQFVPVWARAPIPDKIGTNYVSVSRVLEAGNATQKASLRAAFESIGGTVEVRDNGPLHEDDLRLRGDTRLVRAVAARRPIIAIEAPKLAVVIEQPAVFVLQNQQLVLDGLDLIVNVHDLPRNQDALFLCRGASLTLKNCTITVSNPNAAPFAIFRSIGTTTSRIRLESTMIRGQVLSVLDAASGSVDFAANRSLLLAGTGPLFHLAGVDPHASRIIALSRCVCATRGPLLDVDQNSRGDRPSPVNFRALGSTVAHLAVPGVAGASYPMIVLRDEGAGGSETLNWLGEHNVFVGWNEWLSPGIGRPPRIANLAAARRASPRTDAQSREVPTSWTLRGSLERISASDMKPLAPERLATLTRVASPSPYLFEKTLDTFPRPPVPVPAARLTEVRTDFPPAAVVLAIKAAEQAAARPVPPPAPPPLPPPATAKRQAPSVPTMAPGPFTPPGRVNRPGERVRPTPMPPIVNTIVSGEPAAAPPSLVRELIFNTSEPRWNGDLGLFLHDQVKEGDHCVRVWATGQGTFVFTPYRVPDKTSLEIVCDTRPTRAGVPTWSPATIAGGAPMIELHGGDLVLSGVHVTANSAASSRPLVLVEDGHLVLHACRLTAPGEPANSGGELIAFRGLGTKPLVAPEWPGPFETKVDRPVLRAVDTVLIASNDAITAELGRGMVALSQCAIVSRGNALGLSPSKVARSRFDADLWLDHCTLAAERSFVHLGPWSGAAPGPDRPWLISTQDNAFLGRFQPPSHETVLLRFAPTAMSMGVPFWQGTGDAFDVINFIARSDAPPPTNAFPDVRRQWVSLWGANHFGSVTRPTVTGTSSVHTLSRLRPGRIDVADLALDPDHHPGRSTLSIGADLSRLPTTAPAPRGERPR
jgi:serine/threonine protein kinase